MNLPSRRALAVLYLLCGVVAGLLSLALGQSKNLTVFCHASEALLAGRDLYDGSSVDWFKYSPTFALLFVPLAVVPRWLAAAAWGALNFGAAYVGMDLACADDRRSRIALAAALPGILLATDGDQSNLLVAGVMLAAFAMWTRGRSVRAGVLVAGGALVKVFPLAAALFALLHPDRERSLFRILVALGLAFGMPLLVLRPDALVAEYASWLALLRADHENRGWSLATIARDHGLPVLAVQLACVATVAVPLAVALVGPTTARFHRRFAALLFVVLVLSNHRSEYASFVISAMGLGLWLADGPVTKPRIALVVLAAIATGPIYVRVDPALGGALAFLGAHRLFHPLRLLPLVVAWGLMQTDLLRDLAPTLSRCPER
jgi:hypothetical protein